MRTCATVSQESQRLYIRHWPLSGALVEGGKVCDLGKTHKASAGKGCGETFLL